MSSSNTGYNFLGLVIAGAIVGYIVDKFAGTAPWGLIGFLVIGLVYATYKAQKDMNTPIDKKDDKNE